MSDHARLSPSSAHRWWACPGSVREEAKYPNVSGLSAIDGTHTHTLLERCLRTPHALPQKPADPMDMVGITLNDHEGDFVVDVDRAQRVKLATNYIEAQMASLTNPFLIAEHKVDPAHLMGRDDMSGTLDVQIRAGRFVEIIDYKDGMTPVKAQGNKQLKQYALGVLASFSIPLGANASMYPIDVIQMTIIQPKLMLKGMNAITSHTMTVSELLSELYDWIAKASATDDPDAPLVPGDDQCRFCAAKGGCAALANKAMGDIGLMFKNTPAVTSPTELFSQASDRDPATMTNDQLAEILEALPMIRQLGEAAQEEALRRAKAGSPIPGFKVVNGPGSRQWALKDEEIASKLTKMGVPKKDVYVTKLVSPAQAEKLHWVKGDGSRKTLTKKQLETMGNEYITKMAGKLTLVPESDSRPSAIIDASPMFSAIAATKEDDAVKIIDKGDMFVFGETTVEFVPGFNNCSEAVDKVVTQELSLPSWLT